MKLCLENINKDVDYDDLCFFESHLAHELKRLGKEGFVEKYRNLYHSLDLAHSRLNKIR